MITFNSIENNYVCLIATHNLIKNTPPHCFYKVQSDIIEDILRAQTGLRCIWSQTAPKGKQDILQQVAALWGCQAALCWLLPLLLKVYL